MRRAEKRRRDNTGVISGTNRLVGTVPEIVPIAGLSKNPWNPTAITGEERDRIRHGFKTDGWLVAQALLVWRADERGRVRNVIIDGEQRFTVADELGMTEGPVSFLDGITEAAARRLTVKLNARRAGGGSFDPAKFAANVVSIGEVDLGDVSHALDLGLDDRAFARLTGAAERAPDQTERARVGFVVLVDCDDETHQLAIIEDLMSRGYRCRALT
jgi:ParB-like chromosome segregation protein Spo0J